MSTFIANVKAFAAAHPKLAAALAGCIVGLVAGLIL